MFFTPNVETETKPTTVPAPIGGLNAKDSLAAMPATDAIVMRNWWPQPYGCIVRKGYTAWTTGLPASVNTLATWSATNGTQKLFAWSGAGMYDVTAKGVAAAAIVSGLTSSIWQTVSMTNSAGTHLIAVNGQDNGIIYKPTGVARLILGDGIVVNTWAGLNPALAIQLTVHQRRLWAVEKNTSNGWFLPPDAFQGTFKKFDFGPLFSRGGFLRSLHTWTLDDGNGAEDHLVAISSRGEVAVYQGTDPEYDTTWSLVGVYFIGAPVSGRRSVTKIGGDLGIVTQQGVVSMTETLASTKVNEAQSRLITEKIQFLISELVSTYTDLADWELSYYPKLNMLMINVPSVVLGGNIQLASNQIIESWTEFTEMDAASWGGLASNPYFGDYQGNIWQMWDGGQDKVGLDGTGGTSILTDVQQAYSYYGALAVQKQVGMYRTNFLVSVPVQYASTVLYDYDTADLPAIGVLPPVGVSLWGVGLWGTATWGGGQGIQKPWKSASGMGVAASLRMVMQSENDVLWISTDYSIIGGLGIL